MSNYDMMLTIHFYYNKAIYYASNISIIANYFNNYLILNKSILINAIVVDD
jgi:hypothetical protein